MVIIFLKKTVICAIYWESNFLEVLEITALILGYMYQVQIFWKKTVSLFHNYIQTTQDARWASVIFYIQNDLVNDNFAAPLNSD